MTSGSNIKSLPANALLPLAALMELTLVALPFIEDLRAHVAEAVGLLLATSILYILSVRLILHREKGAVFLNSLPSGRSSLGLILFAAFVFRITVLPLNTPFSDDVYRYRWEGKLQAAAGNPYLATPAAPEWRHLRDSTYPKVDGKTIRAVYGPLMELEQRALYKVAAVFTSHPAKQVLVFRLVSALADLGVVIALLALLRARNLPVERVLIYAWCPLPVMEFWANGHNDSLVLLALALMLVFAVRAHDGWAAVFLSVAAALKIWPLLLFPALTGWRPRRLAVGAGTLVALALVTVAPFGSAVFDNRDFTSGFLGGWRNNDSLFGMVLALVSDPYLAKYITFALVAAAAIAVSLTPWQLERKALATVAAMLACSSNVHPWYAAWLLPMMVIVPAPAGLLFVSAVPVFYEVLIGWNLLGEWNGVSWLRWPVYGGVVIVLLASRLRSASEGRGFDHTAAGVSSPAPAKSGGIPA